MCLLHVSIGFLVYEKWEFCQILVLNLFDVKIWVFTLGFSRRCGEIWDSASVFLVVSAQIDAEILDKFVPVRSVTFCISSFNKVLSLGV